MSYDYTGSKYDERMDFLVFQLKKGKLTTVPVRDKLSGVVCYFCLKSINGRGEVIILNEGRSTETYHLHSRCYGASLLGEMDRHTRE